MPRTNRRRAKKASKPSGRAVQVTAMPPSFNINPVIRRKIRYIANTSTNDALLFVADLATFFTAATATTAYNAFESVKLISIEMWAVASSGFASVSVDWDASSLSIPGNSQRVTATGNTVIPAHLKTSPPAGSGASFWMTYQGGTSYASISYVTGTVIDVVVDVVLRSTSTAATPYTCVGQTAGQMGVGYLDNTANGGGTGPLHLVPQADYVLSAHL